MAGRKVTVPTAGIENGALVLVRGVARHDLCVMAGGDLNRGKVGRPLAKAIFQQRNRTRRFHVPTKPLGPSLGVGSVLDGTISHLADSPEDRAFHPISTPFADITERGR